MDKIHCTGCEDDFYNDKNPYGVEVCWGLRSATLVLRKEVSVDQRPPWTMKPKLLPTCYRKKRFVYLKPEVTQ